MTRMAHDLIRPPKARPGDRIAVVSPSFAAAGAFPAVHDMPAARTETLLTPDEVKQSTDNLASDRDRLAAMAATVER